MDLAKLEEIQLDCAKRVIKEDVLTEIKTVGGIDVTFESSKENPTRAWACMVVINLDTLKPIYQKIIEDIVDFPYIPTFLAFRELPLVKKVYNEAKFKPDVIFIDGQGISHPRGCGIASHFGVEIGAVTVGVAKKKLLGSYEPLEDSRGSYSYLIYNDEITGAVLRTKDKVKPVYVSIGHKISLDKAIELVLKTSIYRIPEPLRLAHNLLQKVRRQVFR
ncbi:endonuclease V [Thermodesulfobacterium sp. TA1]|uniref:endonuclease V n=1 Tax=Thermodesulfobacterium sp. TA1 TaxID=2234087 RepID=UPI001231BF6A|nr:endonuclease V [Thermodesulfobacterium sp. TA1]QER41226.1 endonuclease V [Thermodesulfobacterium sp. TA1]